MMFLVGLIIHPVETYQGWRRRNEGWRPSGRGGIDS